MPYREPAGFFCTAEKLLELIRVIESNRLKYEDIQGEWTKKKHIKWLRRALISMIKKIYDIPETLDSQVLIRFSPRWLAISEIVEFGKKNGIPGQAWLEAIEKNTSSG